MTVVLLQQLDDTQEERMLGHRAHGVVGDTCGCCAAHPRGVGEKRIQAAIAALVHVREQIPWGTRCTHVIQINISSSIVCEHKVPNGVCALDGVIVAIKGIQEPGVFGGNEVARFFVCPKLWISLGT